MEFPQLLFIDALVVQFLDEVVDLPVVVYDKCVVQTVLGQDAGAPVVVRQCVDKVVEVPVVQVDVEMPSSWTRSLTCPLVCNDRCLVVKVQITVEAPQLQFIDKVRVKH